MALAQENTHDTALAALLTAFDIQDHRLLIISLADLILSIIESIALENTQDMYSDHSAKYSFIDTHISEIVVFTELNICLKESEKIVVYKTISSQFL